jgi:hypothetical protein
MTQTASFTLNVLEIEAMTDLISNSSIKAEHQRLMELIEAEDASNGEIGCGRDWGSRFPVYLQTCHINVSIDAFQNLLQEHLGDVLKEPDFYRIISGVHHFIEPIVVDAALKIPSVETKASLESVPEHIPTIELRTRFQQDIGDICSAAQIEQVIQFTHRIIHRSVLSPRHTWLPPIWILTNEQDFYVVQAPDPEDAIAQTRQQYPEETKPLRVVKANNIIAPNQVIKLKK